MMNIIRFTLLFLVLISCARKSSKLVGSTGSVTQVENSYKHDDSNHLSKQLNEVKSNVQVNYYTDSIVAIRIKGFDTSFVSILYQMDYDKIKACDSCIFINDNGKYSMTSNYQINDSLYLLPVLDFNRILLFAINFNSKKLLVNEKLKDNYLVTSLDAIVYNVKKNQVVIADSYGFNEEGELKRVTIHSFKVGKDKFVFLKTNIISADLISASNMKYTLKKLSDD